MFSLGEVLTSFAFKHGSMLYFHSKGMLFQCKYMVFLYICCWCGCRLLLTVRRKVFIGIYVRCVVYFSPLDVVLNNNRYISVLFLGKFIKVLSLFKHIT